MASHEKRRYTHETLPIKQFRSSVAIQLPTTSANDYIDTDESHNTPTAAFGADGNNNHIAHRYSLNYCHHHHSRSISQHVTRGSSTDSGLTSTTDSDESPTPPPNYHEIPGVVPSYQGRTSGPPPSYNDVVNPNAPPPSYQSLFGQVREARKTSNGLVDLFRQLLLILIGTLGCTMIIGFLLLIPITMILVGFFYVNECRAENIPSFLVIGGFVWIVKNILNCYNQFKKDSSTANRPPPRRVPISSSPSSTSSSSTTMTITANGIISPQAPTGVLIVDHTQPSIIATTSVDSGNDNPQDQDEVSQVPTSTSASTVPATTTIATRSTRPVAREQQATNRIRQPSLIGITSFKCESMLNYFLIVWFLAGCIVVYRIYEPDYDNPMSSSYCNRTVYLYAFWLMTSTFIIMAIVLSCLCCLMASSLISCNHGR